MENINHPLYRFLRNGIITIACTLSMIACKKQAVEEKNEMNSATAALADADPDLRGARPKDGPKMVCYIGTNNYDIRSAGDYTLTNTGQPLFDIGIIFAANINRDPNTKKAVLYFNKTVQATLDHRKNTIQPLQKKGIKILLSILGNHQGAGVCNFPNRAAARIFAQSVKNAVVANGLDGIDIDDEYAKYDPVENDSSFVNLITELRNLMPNKIISFYFFGPAKTRLSYRGRNVGPMINYSWNAVYGTFNTPNVPGLGKNDLSPAAVDMTFLENTTRYITNVETAKKLARQTMNQNYGMYLCYDLNKTDNHVYLSEISKILYGSPTTYTPPAKSY